MTIPALLHLYNFCTYELHYSINFILATHAYYNILLKYLYIYNEIIEKKAHYKITNS